MKRILAILLTFAILASCFFALCTISASAEGVGSDTAKLREAFSADLKGTKNLESDGHLGVPVNLSTFYRESVTSNGVNILYVVGHNEERIGTDTDEDIIDDMLNEGYCVTVLDYLGNPKAVGNEFGWSVHKIFTGNFKSKSYDFGYVRKTHDNMYVVPSGCRIDREIYYFSIDEMGLNGTNEYILWLWNTYYAGPDGIKKDAQGNDLPYAETIYDMIKPDGSPIDFDLRMDVVYPSNPEETVPVYALASSAEERTMSLSNTVRPYFTTAVLQGYAGVIYDHEYIPMSRQDHYKYYGNYTLPYSSFTLGTTNANAVHSAAIRKIRYMADKYGYNGDYVAAWGFSKSGPGPAILANTKHEEMGEITDFGEYVPEGKDPKGYQGEQPWLYYEGTDEKISSNITVAYSGSGAGICQYRERLMTKDSVPIVSSIGTADTTGNFNTYIPAAKNYLDSHPEIESDFLIPEGLGHNPAYGYDNVKQIEQFDEIWCWLDNHVRAAYRDEAPEVLWATPSSNKIYDFLTEPVTVKFSRAMDVESVKENLKVIRLSDGKAIGGTWEVLHGDTTFRFTSPLIINASSYRISVGTETKAADGVKLGTEYAKIFTVSGDKLISVSKDTYVSSADPDKNFGAEKSLNVLNNNVHNKAFISFNNAEGYQNVTKALLLLNRKEEKVGCVSVYAIDDFDENAVTYKNAPENGALVGSGNIESEITTIDITDYVKNFNGKEMSFALETAKEKVFYKQSFDEIASTGELVYDVDYRWGGGTAVMTLSDDAKDGSKSIYVTNRAQNGNRIKFLKSFGTDTLTSEHLGLTVKASFWIKTEADTSVTVAAYEHKALSGIYPQAFSVNKGEWTYIEYVVTVTQEMIDGNNRAITVVPNKNGNYYLDGFKVELLTGGIETVSSEYIGESEIAPTLVLYTPESKVFDGSVAVIGSGDKADSVLNENASVSGKKEEGIGSTQKGYIKFPISEFDLTADSINLTFEASSSNKAEFSVYGVLGENSALDENFADGITWNNAYGNNTETNGVDTEKTVLIDTVSVTGTEKLSLDVKDYVTQMVNLGCESVTFIIVKENSNKMVSRVSFQNMESYSAYVKSSSMALFDVGVTADPVNTENSVLYFNKSGENAGTYPGYSQNICLTGLIQGDDTFDESDIGRKYTVSFKMYTEAPGDTAGNFCNITKAGSSTSNNVTAGVTRTISSTKTGQWNTVTFDFTVTSDMVKNNATSILIATGWAVTRVYIDDVVVEESVGNLIITLNTESEDKDINFNGLTEYNDINRSAGMDSYAYGIAKDPTDETNDVFYFDRDAYKHSASFSLISPTNKYRTSDVGKVITITYRQYNSGSEGGSSGVLCTIGSPVAEQYFLPAKGVERYINGNASNSAQSAGTYGLANNQWHTVKFVVTVTEDMVGTSCALVVASGAAIKKIYIDDIVVKVEKEDNRTVPTLEFKKGDVTEYSVYDSAAVINGGNKDKAYGQQSGVMAVEKTPSGGESGIKKVYAYFDKTGYYHILNGKISFNAVGNAGDKVYVYAVNKECSIENITWNTAYGNDTSNCSAKAGQVYGGAPVAEITLDSGTSYTADVTDALIEYEANNSVTFIFTTSVGTKSIELSNITLNASSVVYDEGEIKAEMLETVTVDDLTVLAVDASYRIDYMIESVLFYVDGKEKGAATVNGQVTKVKVKNLAEGKHNAYAVVTYTDGTTVTSDTVEFTVEGQNVGVVYGDLNGNAKVDGGDLALMKLYLAGSISSSDINQLNADIDANGKITGSDLAELKLYLAGAISTLGPK